MTINPKSNPVVFKHCVMKGEDFLNFQFIAYD